MALYMDVHTLDGPVAMADVAAAHAADLATQDQHGVHYLRYWVDESAGKIFCLVDAPDAEAANTVHRGRTVSSPTRIHLVSEGEAVEWRRARRTGCPLAELVTDLDDALAGSGHVVFLGGEAGSARRLWCAPSHGSHARVAACGSAAPTTSTPGALGAFQDAIPEIGPSVAAAGSDPVVPRTPGSDRRRSRTAGARGPALGR
jgi:hypothetical protein